MNTDGHRFPAKPEELGDELNKLSERIIGCAYVVANTLGSGFLEKVYENALARELRKSGLLVRQQHPISVSYDGAIVGKFAADLFVANRVLVELKACRTLDESCLAQCLNYLKATKLRLCLLINFGTPRVQIRRIAL
jgi:GxxExxY protein